MAKTIGVLVIGVFLALGWADRSDVGTIDTGLVGRMLVISDAGPVEVTRGEQNRVTHSDSWLVRPPQIEVVADDDEAVVRIRCRTSWPCRSAVKVETRPGVELVVIAADGGVQLESFEGALTVFADQGEIVAGPLVGSARLVNGSAGVRGFGLGLTELTVDVDEAPIDVQFAQSPSSVVLSSAEGPIRLEVPDTGYQFTIRTPEDSVDDVDISLISTDTSDAQISIRTDGPITVVPFAE